VYWDLSLSGGLFEQRICEFSNSTWQAEVYICLNTTVTILVGELRVKMIRPPYSEQHPNILGSQRWNPFFKVTCILHRSQLSCEWIVVGYIYIYITNLFIALMILGLHWCHWYLLEFHCTCKQHLGVGSILVVINLILVYKLGNVGV
jgi:hypothetical protein